MQLAIGSEPAAQSPLALNVPHTPVAVQQPTGLIASPGQSAAISILSTHSVSELGSSAPQPLLGVQQGGNGAEPAPVQVVAPHVRTMFPSQSSEGRPDKLGDARQLLLAPSQTPHLFISAQQPTAWVWSGQSGSRMLESMQAPLMKSPHAPVAVQQRGRG